MLQVEIYEYNQKLNEIYHNYYNQFEIDNSNENKNKDIFNFDENINFKFQLIKKINHPNITKYLDLKKEDSKIYMNLINLLLLILICSFYNFNFLLLKSKIF